MASYNASINESFAVTSQLNDSQLDDQLFHFHMYLDVARQRLYDKNSMIQSLRDNFSKERNKLLQEILTLKLELGRVIKKGKEGVRNGKEERRKEKEKEKEEQGGCQLSFPITQRLRTRVGREEAQKPCELMGADVVDPFVQLTHMEQENNTEECVEHSALERAPEGAQRRRVKRSRY